MTPSLSVVKLQKLVSAFRKESENATESSVFYVEGEQGPYPHNFFQVQCQILNTDLLLVPIRIEWGLVSWWAPASYILDEYEDYIKLHGYVADKARWYKDSFVKLNIIDKAHIMIVLFMTTTPVDKFKGARWMPFVYKRQKHPDIFTIRKVELSS